MACRLNEGLNDDTLPGNFDLFCTVRVRRSSCTHSLRTGISFLRGQIFAGISLIGVPRNVTTTTQHDFPTKMVALSSYHHKTSCSYALLSKTFETARYSLLKYMTSVALVFDIAALGCSIFDQDVLSQKKSWKYNELQMYCECMTENHQFRKCSALKYFKLVMALHLVHNFIYVYSAFCHKYTTKDGQGKLMEGKCDCELETVFLNAIPIFCSPSFLVVSGRIPHSESHSPV